MAGEDRTAVGDLALLRALERKPFAFHFLQALRRLECLYRDKPRIGTSLRPADDALRLGQEPSLAFAPSTITSFRASRPARMQVAFFGLFGPNGPLPLHLTEYARDRFRNANDPTLVRFADLFHHRLLSLFYRAWAQAEPAVQFDRPESDRFSTYVASLAGLAAGAMRDRDAMPDLAKWYFAGRMGAQAKNSEGLRAILEVLLGVAVRVVEFVGHWMELPPDCRLRLGESPATGTLGDAAVVGSRIWDCQSKFRLVLGPLDFAEYLRLVPGGDSQAQLTAALRNYVGDELLCDVNLVLRRDEVPRTCLGRTGRLGYTSWLISRPPDEDADDLVVVASVHGRRRARAADESNDRNRTPARRAAMGIKKPREELTGATL